VTVYAEYRKSMLNNVGVITGLGCNHENIKSPYANLLTSLGTADEVGEIIIELQWNVPAANRLFRKAVEAKFVFSGDYLLESVGINDAELPVALCISLWTLVL